ncbi:MAG: hypothetical protein ACREOW_11690 [Thermodesulfobacteriota bacterium]
MTTTEYKYSPSVNIVRDINISLNYIPTPNAKKVFNQLINDYNLGIRSFNIIGTYGSGKSVFLWALEKNLNRKTNYFGKPNGQFNQIQSFEFVPIIGEYNSIIASIIKQFGINKNINLETQDLINQVDKYYGSLRKSNKGLVIVIDEFGKFLEYASKNNPEKELYFIQQLAEHVNDTEKNILLITTLHQDFNAYALALTKSQRQEWNKVKGRLKELTFNEPVEQLLYLASERLALATRKHKKTKGFSKLFSCIKTAKAFPLRDYFSEDFAEKLLPFDILSASVLTLALQRYGQNERSLFSFIESNDYLGLKDFNRQNNPYYNISCVYDYLMHNFYSFLSTKYNPHYTQWAAIRTAIERAEGVLEKQVDDAIKLIKTIGLLNIFATASAKIDANFLSGYGKYSLGTKSSEELIRALETHKIIRFVKHNFKYILFEGTDLDIELAIEEAGNLVDPISNLENSLNQYFYFPFIPAKAVYYEKGTPRFFAFRLSEESINLTPKGETDGFINLIFSGKLREEDIRTASEKCNEAILYGWYKNSNQIRNLIFEIEKVKKVREKNLEDKVALRELDSIIEHETSLLNRYVIESLSSSNSTICWYFSGKKLSITGRGSFNRVLSAICNQVYKLTPIFKTELVNKTKLSSAVSTARRNLIGALVNDWDKKDLGFPQSKFPPEKSIYLSLLRETGIHRKASLYDEEVNNGFTLAEPTEQSFKPLWNKGIEFLESAKVSRRNLKELVEMFSSKPFKLKKGFIDFWLPIFLFIKRDYFALFQDSVYIPYINEGVLDLVVKSPNNFEIKTFDIEGGRLDLFNQYRSLLNQSQRERLSNQSFIETIKPFLTFYKGLPEYTKRTKRLNKRTLALRETIANSKDPEKTFFEDFPSALGYNVTKLQGNPKELEQYIFELRESIKEIRTCYDELINRVGQFLLDEVIGEHLAFPEYKIQLQDRFKKLKIHLLLPYQKVFYQRLVSELDDRKSWLNSMAHACIGKSMDIIDDEDEYKLYDRLKEIIHELDNLCELSRTDINLDKEEVFKLEITSFVEGLKKNVVRLPRNKVREVVELENKIKDILGKDKQLNVATLTKLLQEQLKDE